MLLIITVLSSSDKTCISLPSPPRLKDTRVTATVMVLIGQKHVEMLLYHDFIFRHSRHIYNRPAHISHSLGCMKPNLQGLMWFECREISKEALLMGFMYNL